MGPVCENTKLRDKFSGALCGILSRPMRQKCRFKICLTLNFKGYIYVTCLQKHKLGGQILQSSPKLSGGMLSQQTQKKCGFLKFALC